MFTAAVVTFTLLNVVFAKIHHEHIFNKYTDMNVPSNWKNGRPPCGDQEILFPKTLNHEVMWNVKDLAPKKVYFPMNGNIIFNGDGITISDTATCAESPISNRAEYKPPPNPYRFLDHRHWDSPADAILDVERVPNSCSAAVFYMNHTYYVSLWTKTFIGEMRMHGKVARTAEDMRALTGYKSFKSTFTFSDSTFTEEEVYFTIDEKTRDDPDGCYNTNLEPELMKEVFRTVPDCGTDVARRKAMCSKTIGPIGNKCRVCGAQIIFEATESEKVDIDALRETLKKNADPHFTKASLLRIDPKKRTYQVTILQYNTSEAYDDVSTKNAYEDILAVLKTTSYIKITSSKVSEPYSTQTGLLATVILAILFILSAVGYVLSRLWNRKVAGREQPVGMMPVFKRGKEGDDQLELSVPKTEEPEGTFRFKKLLETDVSDDEL